MTPEPESEYNELLGYVEFLRPLYCRLILLLLSTLRT